MSTSTKRFFLARNQKTFGPISADEVESLRQSGQLAQYAWIFQEGDTQWTPVDPPPALPVTAAPVIQRGNLSLVPEPPIYEGTTTETPAHEVPRARRLPKQAFRVILFDHRNAISGWIAEASDSGCVVRCDQGGSDPQFVQKELACLTLHDSRTGDGLKLKVRISEISREGHGWCYRIRWNAAPALLSRPQLSVAA